MVYFLILHPLLLLAAIIITGAERAAIYPLVDYESQSQSEDGKVPLYVGLIQSYDPSSPDAQLDSTGTIVGTEIALDHINADESMLPGYRLHYSFVGSQCKGVEAVDAFFHLVFNPPTKLGIIGAGCSPSTQEAALVSQFYNITQISCIATSPTLADRTTYRRYFQLLPPEFESARGFYSIITWYKWKRVGVILQEADLFEKTFIELREQLSDEGVHLPSYKFRFEDLEMFKDDVFDFDNFNGIRIFLILTYESVAVPMLCEAYKRGYWYPRYHFLLLGWYSPEWWKDVQSNCTVAQLELALQHSLTVDLLPDARVLGDDWEATDLGISNGEYYKAERNHTENPTPPLNLTFTNYLSQYCYDATWAFALALNKTIEDLETNFTLNELAKASSAERNMSGPFRMEHFDYGNTVILEQMMENWNSTAFRGITGNVSFTNGLRELLRIRVTQYLTNDTGHVEEVHIGHLIKQNSFTIADIVDAIEWPDGQPHDGEENEVVDPVHLSVTVVMSILGFLGILFAILCLLLNFLLRSKVIIRLSSPNLNYMIGGGAILLYIAVILAVVPVGEGDSARATALCVITPWFTAIGYSLCYGTILVKMFRTWYIFNKPIANKKEMKDWLLTLIVLLLVALDVIILVVYTGLECTVGSGATRVVNREQEISSTGPQQITTRHYVYVCKSIERSITLGILYGYKAILQIIALLLSFATWNVKVRGLDDAKAITVSTYVTSLVLAVVIVSDYSLREFINAHALVFGIGFFTGTTLILVLVFMTKMYFVIKDPKGENVFSSKSLSGVEPKSPNTKHEEEIVTLKKRVQELETTMSTSTKDNAQSNGT